MSEYLTKEEKELLQQIVSDKFSVGPFVGMVYNIQMDASNKGIVLDTEYLIKRALALRLKAVEMSK